MSAPRGLRAYILFIGVLGALSLAWASRSQATIASLDWMLFLALSVTFANFPIRVGSEADVVFLMPLTLALIAMNGPFPGIIAAVVGVLASQVIGRKSWDRSLFNSALIALEAGAAGFVFRLSGHLPAEPMSLPLVLIVLLMSLAGLIVNVVVFAGLITLLSSGDFWRHLASVAGISSRQAPVEALVAILFLSIFQSIGRVGLLFMAVLLVLVRYGFQAYFQLRNAYEEAQGMLISILDARDKYTAGHSTRVSENAIKLAVELKLQPRDIENIRRAGLLHDIGKVNVPDNILQKPGKLDETETRQMNQHPVDGARFVEGVSSLKHLSPIIRHHHERYNGKGYPDGISGETIPLGARVLSVADAFDAMITDRPYRKALTRAQALQQILENAGTQFDKQVAMAAVKVLGPGLQEYPQLQSLAAAVRLQLAATKEELPEGQA